jgi:hypothetical protein
MPSQNDHPKWWQLYITLPLLLVLFIFDSRLQISSRGHTIVQIGIVLLIYGCVCLWLRANARALSRMDQRQIKGKITVIQFPPYQPDDAKNDKHPIFVLPNSEIKGVLSDTFEMDYIDVELSPIDEVSQDVDKE